MSEAIDMAHYDDLSQLDLEALIAKPPIDPRGNFLLVRVLPIRETFGDSGIIIGTAKEIDREQKGAGLGYVIAMGTGCYLDMEEGPWCAVGDRVAFQRYEGVIPPIEGLDRGHFRIISDNKILGVL